MIILCLIALVYSHLIFACFLCFLVVAQFHLTYYSYHLHECDKTGKHQSFLLLVHYTLSTNYIQIPFWVTSGVFSNASVYVFLIINLFMKNYIFIGLTSCVSVNKFQHLAFPGQIELFTHIPVLRNFVEHLKRKNFNVCAVYLLDSQV